MFRAEPCKACGVPSQIARTLVWNTDGTITQKRDPEHRMVLVESDGLNVLFANIESLIGISIEKIIIESKSRATNDFIRRAIRGPKGTIARIIGLQRVINRVQKLGRALGYGNTEVLSIDWKKSEIMFRTADPYSIALVCGDLRGATEAIRKLKGTIEYKEIEPDTYLIHGFLAPLQPGIEERLVPPSIPRKPGDIEYERCPRCGVPAKLSEFKWDMEKGIIRHKDTGLRFVFTGPVGIQVIFDELESELGETIPETIVEAQRMHSQTIAADLWGKMISEDFRRWLGVMGMGNLVEMEVEEGGLSARVENASLPIMLVGSAVAFQEHVSNKKVKADWSVSEDGTLELSTSTEDPR